jgi:hypothetical protein
MRFEQSEGAPSTTKKAAPTPESLCEFFLAERAHAQRFVQALAKRPALSDDDLTRSRAIVDSEPKKMRQVLDLARAIAISTTHSGSLLRWCEEVVRSRDEALRNWALDPAQDAGAAFSELLAWAHPFLQLKADKAKRELAETCLLIGLNLLIAGRSLSPLDALRVLTRATAAHGGRRGAASIERAVAKQLTRAGFKQVLDLARVAALSEKEVTSAKEATRTAVILAGDLRREKEALEAERAKLHTEIEDLTRELNQRNKQIRELSADVEGAKVRALHDLHELKARFRRKIEGLSGLMSDAWDAIDTDPPHPTVIRERLETAQEAIRRELEWLSKSSD